MSTLLNASEIKEQASLATLLARLGFEPQRRSGKELMYLSMLRDSDTSPSFCVNDDLGVWYDHGSGKGGNVIDFGLAYWRTLSFREVLERIRELCNLEVLTVAAPDTERKSRARMARKLPHYKIEDIKPLGTNPAITAYLQVRGVWGVAAEYLRELYYYVEDEKKLRKHFFSAGWQNENGGWEVRNKYFKGCLGHKGMSFIPGDPARLAVFEGFLDYLSWSFEQENKGESVLVLNTLSFIGPAINRAKKYAEVAVFFDHDDAGEKALAAMKEQIPYSLDGSLNYQGYKDYNEKLMAEMEALCSYKSMLPKKDIFEDVKVGFAR